MANTDKHVAKTFNEFFADDKQGLMNVKTHEVERPNLKSKSLRKGATAERIKRRKAWGAKKAARNAKHK